MLTVKKAKITETTTNSKVNYDRSYPKRVFEMLMVFTVIKTAGWLKVSVAKMSSWLHHLMQASVEKFQVGFMESQL